MSIVTDYVVTGMTCAHCGMSVREEIAEIPTVTEVEVDVPTGKVVVTSREPVSTDLVEAAVEEAGYQLVSADSSAR